jgi:hypothetical protein
VILGSGDAVRAEAGWTEEEENGAREEPPGQDDLPGCRPSLPPPSFRLLHVVPCGRSLFNNVTCEQRNVWIDQRGRVVIPWKVVQAPVGRAFVTGGL